MFDNVESSNLASLPPAFLILFSFLRPKKNTVHAIPHSSNRPNEVPYPVGYLGDSVVKNTLLATRPPTFPKLICIATAKARL